MISIENIGEVCGFRLARSILGRDLYYTAEDPVIVRYGESFSAGKC